MTNSEPFDMTRKPRRCIKCKGVHMRTGNICCECAEAIWKKHGKPGSKIKNSRYYRAYDDNGVPTRVPAPRKSMRTKNFAAMLSGGVIHAEQD